MIKLADIFEYKNGKKKIEFFELGIYDLLKEKLGFRYAKINGKGYYLKEKDGIYEISYFHHLGDDFREYLEREFENLDISKETDFHSFMNEYYKKRPIRNGNYARDYLSEDFQLTDSNLHLILLEIDSKYRFEYERKEMLAFLKNENFVKTTDNIGNFNKDCPLFYKRISENKYVIFNMPFCKSKSKQATFDFWKINSRTEKDFLLKKTEKIVTIKLGFNLPKDLELYIIEKEKTI